MRRPDPRRLGLRRLDPLRRELRRRLEGLRPATRPRLSRELIGSPFQLLLLACSFALAAYAGVRLLSADWSRVALWFVGAAVLHDLVLVPLYAGADRVVSETLDATGHRDRTMYVRVPAALSGLLLLVWFPLISGQIADHYRSATALPADGFLAHWLLITAVLFAGSALLLLLRSLRASRRGPLRRATKDRPPAAH
jgi:MFS family permease